MTQAELANQLGTPTFGIVFVIVPHRERPTYSESSYHSLTGHSLRDSSGIIVRLCFGGGGKVGAYPFVACLRRSNIDHASLPRRSTVGTANMDTPPTFGR